MRPHQPGQRLPKGVVVRRRMCVEGNVQPLVPLAASGRGHSPHSIERRVASELMALLTAPPATLTSGGVVVAARPAGAWCGAAAAAAQIENEGGGRRKDDAAAEIIHVDAANHAERQDVNQLREV